MMPFPAFNLCVIKFRHVSFYDLPPTCIASKVLFFLSKHKLILVYFLLIRIYCICIYLYERLCIFVKFIWGKKLPLLSSLSIHFSASHLSWFGTVYLLWTDSMGTGILILIYSPIYSQWINYFNYYNPTILGHMPKNSLSSVF